MASRKEQKEQARAARLAQEQQLAAQRQRTRRLQIFGGALAVAVIVIVVAIVLSSTGGKNNATGILKGKQGNQTAAQVDAMFKNIPQSGTVLGNPKAKVTMIYFGDLECPICKAFTVSQFPQFVQQEVKPGTVKVDYKSLCTATCNNTSVSNPQQLFTTQQVAAYAAGKQNRFWNFADLFYREQGAEDTGYVTSSYLQGLASQAGVNLSKWKTDRGDPSLLSQVDADEALGQKDAPNGTPTLIMEGPKGEEAVNGNCTVDGSSYGFPCAPTLESAVKAVS